MPVMNTPVPAINILMLGGKRCGKTTVLSSMCSQIGKALAATDLSLVPKNNTVYDLQRAGNAIRDKIGQFKNPLVRTAVDENPTGAHQVYEFSFGIPGFPPIDLNIHDIPGEWLINPLHENKVKGLIACSHVIIIAIDTPYLFYKMTDKGYGQYHEEYNKPKEITNFFLNSLSPAEIRDRMVLFVPLKCERYYHLTFTKEINPSHRNYMGEIFDSVCTGYRDLLFYLRSTPQLAGSLTLAVTPILSAGGIDFVKFTTDKKTGKIVSLYQEPEFLPSDQKGYCPKFCEQPIIYALTYMMRLGIDGLWKPSGWMASRRNETLIRMTNTYETLRKRMQRSSGVSPSAIGYYIIQNPRNI